MAVLDAAGNASSFHLDGLGDTSRLTNGSGAATQTYSYDAHGNVTASSGGGTNPYLAATGDGFRSLSGGLGQGISTAPYDPAAGRYASPSLKGYSGGANLYTEWTPKSLKPSGPPKTLGEVPLDAVVESTYSLFKGIWETQHAAGQNDTLGTIEELDNSSLELVDASWGARTVAAPEAARAFHARTAIVDHRPGDLRPWWVDLEAGESAPGRLSFTFRTLDPATGGLPADALAGFLPPEDGSGRGKGSVLFSVRTKSSLAPGTRIASSATIVFDTEAPITTNEVFHTIGLPGDVNDDGLVNPADVFYLVNFFYSAGPAPLASAQGAQDVLRFGVPSGTGPLIVPITLSDTAGTPLGIDRPAGQRIQAIAITVR